MCLNPSRINVRSTALLAFPPRHQCTYMYMIVLQSRQHRRSRIVWQDTHAGRPCCEPDMAWMMYDSCPCRPWLPHAVLHGRTCTWCGQPHDRHSYHAVLSISQQLGPGRPPECLCPPFRTVTGIDLLIFSFRRQSMHY